MKKIVWVKILCLVIAFNNSLLDAAYWQVFANNTYSELKTNSHTNI